MTEIITYKAEVDIPFIEADLDGFHARRANLLEAITKELGPNDYKTNIKAKMTKWNMHDYDDFKWISDQALALLWKYDRRGEGVWSCTSIWGAEYTADETAIDHNHYPASWSAIVYVDCPKGSGATWFPLIDRQVKPKDGKICMFPGHLRHSTKPSFCDKRIIISLNIYPNPPNVI